MTFRRPRPRKPRQMKPAVVELSIESLGARGDGLASLDGNRVFVPFALPGERVRVEVAGASRDGVRARLLEVLGPSADRVAPTCRHFGDCGGCALQHLNADAMALWKRERVVAALSQRGLEGIDVGATLSVSPGTRRRAIFAYRRTGGGVLLGFNAAASGRIVDQQECPLLDSRLGRLVAPLRELLGAVTEPGDAGALVAIRLDDGVDLCIDLRTPPGLAVLDRLTAFGRDQGLARLSWRQDGVVLPVATYRQARLRIGDIEVAPPPNAFLQPSAEGEAAIAQRVLAVVGRRTPVADLFCGIGTFALRLVGRGAVYAADGDAALVSVLAATGRVETEVRDLFRRPLMGRELARFEAVVFDPPRAGAAEQATALAEGGPPVVVAVSCNPATFARDARLLVDGGYAPESVTPIDQFPWSPHVELVACFRR